MKLGNSFNLYRTILLGIAFSLFLEAQSQNAIDNYTSFGISAKEVVWTKSFETRGTVNEMITRLNIQLGQNKFIHNIRHYDDGIEASIKNATIDFKKFDVSFINTSNKISYGKWSGHVRIKFIGTGYQVTVYNLSYTAWIESSKWGNSRRPPYEDQSTLSNFALDESKTKFLKASVKDLNILHVTLFSYFMLTPTMQLQNPSVATAF